MCYLIGRVSFTRPVFILVLSQYLGWDFNESRSIVAFEGILVLLCLSTCFIAWQTNLQVPVF